MDDQPSTIAGPETIIPLVIGGTPDTYVNASIERI